MTEELMQKIADSLLGTCDTVNIVLERMDKDDEEYDIEEIIDSLLDFQVERCQHCGWWFECCELVAENDEDNGNCEDCRNDNK